MIFIRNPVLFYGLSRVFHPAEWNRIGLALLRFLAILSLVRGISILDPSFFSPLGDIVRFFTVLPLSEKYITSKYTVYQGIPSYLLRSAVYAMCVSTFHPKMRPIS